MPLYTIALYGALEMCILLYKQISTFDLVTLALFLDLVNKIKLENHAIQTTSLHFTETMVDLKRYQIIFKTTILLKCTDHQ